MGMMQKTKIELQNFSHNVKWLRETHHLSRTKMSKLLGVTIKTLTRIEAGDTPKHLTMRVLFRIWDHFGVHPVDQLEKRLGEK